MAAEFVNAPALTQAGLTHAFSLRDVPAARLSAHLGAGSAGLREAKQVHGAAVLVAGRAPVPEGTEADALVTAEPGVAVAIKVADCVPLVAFTDTGAVAAIHAGWRGFVAGVIPNALAELGRVGRSDRVGRWKVVIGPHIGPCCFEVGADVAGTIAAASQHREGVVVARENGKNPHVDLELAVRVHLARAGIASENVIRLDGCTRCDAERFHSYRRDGANAGRHRIAAVASAR